MAVGFEPTSPQPTASPVPTATAQPSTAPSPVPSTMPGPAPSPAPSAAPTATNCSDGGKLVAGVDYMRLSVVDMDGYESESGWIGREFDYGESAYSFELLGGTGDDAASLDDGPYVAIIVASDWHSKRPDVLRLYNGTGAKILCEWEHIGHRRERGLGWRHRVVREERAGLSDERQHHCLQTAPGGKGREEATTARPPSPRAPTSSDMSDADTWTSDGMTLHVMTHEPIVRLRSRDKRGVGREVGLRWQLHRITESSIGLYN